MRAFEGEESKAEVLARLAAHRAADEIIQGKYWEDGRGCAVGCLTHDPQGGQDQFPERWGIPENVAWVIDYIFEALPVDVAKDWPLRIMSAIPEGGDLTGVAKRYRDWRWTGVGATYVQAAADELVRRVQEAR